MIIIPLNGKDSIILDQKAFQNIILFLGGLFLFETEQKEYTFVLASTPQKRKTSYAEITFQTSFFCNFRKEEKFIEIYQYLENFPSEDFIPFGNFILNTLPKDNPENNIEENKTKLSFSKNIIEQYTIHFSAHDTINLRKKLKTFLLQNSGKPDPISEKYKKFLL